jgi:uncharacterized protein (DUF2062 family)
MKNNSKMTRARQGRNRFLAPLSKAYERFLKIRGHPREIALGLALGLYVGMTPLMGLHTVIALPLAALFKWNKISAAVGVWITNALTAPLIYSINYFVGASIIGTNARLEGINTDGLSTLYTLMLKTPEIFWAMTIGGGILGVPLAVGGYYFADSVVRKYREDLKIRLAKSRAKRKRKKALKQTRPRSAQAAAKSAKGRH